MASVVITQFTKVPDIKEFIADVHSFRGAPRGPGMGMKGLPWGA